MSFGGLGPHPCPPVLNEKFSRFPYNALNLRQENKIGVGNFEIGLEKVVLSQCGATRL